MLWNYGLSGIGGGFSPMPATGISSPNYLTSLSMASMLGGYVSPGLAQLLHGGTSMPSYTSPGLESVGGLGALGAGGAYVSPGLSQLLSGKSSTAVALDTTPLPTVGSGTLSPYAMGLGNEELDASLDTCAGVFGGSCSCSSCGSSLGATNPYFNASYAALLSQYFDPTGIDSENSAMSSILATSCSCAGCSCA